MRELRNCVERLVIMVPGETITAADLGLPAPRATAGSHASQLVTGPGPSLLKATLNPPDPPAN